MAIKYGLLSEYLPAAPCKFVIPEDKHKLPKAGNSLWHACYDTAQAINVVVWDATQSELTHYLPFQIRRTSAREETETSWSGLSQDLELIHKGLAPSGAGSKGSYYFTMVFLQGQIRALGYTVLNNLVRMAVIQPHFDLQHLVTMYRILASPIVEFCGYMGTGFLLEMHEKIDAAIKHSVENNPDKLEARGDFLAMIGAFGQYVTMLNAQNLQLFPWKLGAEYQIVLPAS
ncbi:hypothetical protein AnigIFM63604_010398 [Aspergillus niger]|uniref:Cucumopine synthase C-terminal helical bundle domain-containing protein n=1 Tax=Aspergillus niger TaxID=5061 RepID=A0A9W6EEF5_ASPNG|nr:hypothetical protein AnigIFM63604_010398 [Aspergillus niger]